MSIITRANERPLDNRDLQQLAPAIFAEQPYQEVSDRYTFVPTISVVDALRDNGWYPVQAEQSNARRENGTLYAKHLVRFRHRDSGAIVEVDDIAPEVVLYNSHDAGASFQLHAGLYRKVCANGLVIADSTFASIRAVHKGDAIDEIIEGSYEVINEAPKVMDKVKQLQAVETNQEERLLLANAAAQLRWEEDKAPIDPKRLLVPRRYGDNREDLWTVYNVLQENLIRGGLQGVSANGRRTRTREVKAPQQNIGLNKALFTLAEGFIELKKAA